MKTHYGQISLTNLNEIAAKHPELVKEVNFRDGHKEKFINIDIHDKKAPDKFGNTAFIKVKVNREEEKQGVNYFVGDLKRADQQPKTEQNDFDAPLPPLGGTNVLPF